jgi:hypothetical protein
MVACRYDNLHIRTQLGGIRQEFIVGRLGICRRISIVEHIACHKQRIGLMSVYLPQQPSKEMLVLGKPVVTMKHVSKVPITRC